MFKRSRCKHCGTELHGNGLRVLVASMRPEAYARSRSVKAQCMKEGRSGSAGGGVRKESARAGNGAAERNALLPKLAGAPRRASEDRVVRQHHQPETRAETTERIWKKVRSRMSAKERKGSTGDLRHGHQELS